MMLRDYQQQLIDDLRSCYRNGQRSVLLVAPTGAGKTRIFCFIAWSSSRRNRRTLVLVHRQELLRQTSETLIGYGIAHDTGFGGEHPVRVSSVQSAVRRIDRCDWQPDLIVVDEAHHATAGSTWGRMLDHYPGASILGCTATPERLDGRGLGLNAGGYFEALVMGPSVTDLVAGGYLSPPAVYAPSAPDLGGVATRAGDYANDELVRVMDKPALTGDAVAHYRRLCDRTPAIAFCASVKHAENVARQFRAAGYRSEAIDGRLDDATRRERIEALGSGRLDVLTSCEIISEGTDVPVVGAAILLRPTQSLALYLQQVGRALRPYPGKERATILDHAGNSYRHGLPDDARTWSLDASRRSRRGSEQPSVAIRQCEQCYHVHRPAPACPQCGYVYPRQEREPEVRDGDLALVTERRVPKSQGACRNLGDLIAFARAKGYANPYAWAKFVQASRGR